MPIRSLYVHIPFCHAKCAYCAFDSCGLTGAALDEAVERYLEPLHARLEAFGQAGALAELETVYIGGGTPSVLGTRLSELVRRVRTWCAPVEVSCEANPESFDARLARELAAAGVTRISLGVQSLQDPELAAIGRLHTASRALEAVRCARAAGLATSVDLICGLPRQTVESWGETLAGIVACDPGHVSVYPLAVEEGTPLAALAEAGAVVLPDEDAQADAMEEAARVLGAAGYERYEVASYARPGRACRHNIAYWTGVEYLGIGRSAAGMLSARTFRELRNCFPGVSVPSEGAERIRLVQRDDEARRFDVEALSRREAVVEDFMLALRIRAGAGTGLVQEVMDEVGTLPVRRAMQSIGAVGLGAWELMDSARLDFLLGRDGDRAEKVARGARRAGLADLRFVPTERGWLMGNELYGRVWDLADAS